jgi:hypothetical protein
MNKRLLSGEIVSMPLINHPVFCDFVSVRAASSIKQHIKQMMLLYGHNKERMKKVFGRQTTTVNLASRYWVWEVPYKNETFLVYCSKEGTAYELLLGDRRWNDIRNNKELGHLCVKFWKYMYRKLREAEKQ